MSCASYRRARGNPCRFVQSGTLNTTALVVPDLYVQIVPPQNLVVNGVPTNIVGIVGSSAWGPVNRPVIVSTMADYARSFGQIQGRKFDLGTHVATAVQQGAQNFRCVRVTDGTDTAATYAFFYGTSGYPVLLTACYTGSLGNQIGVQLTPGSAAGSWRLTLGLPGQDCRKLRQYRGSLAGDVLAKRRERSQSGAGTAAWAELVMRRQSRRRGWD